MCFLVCVMSLKINLGFSILLLGILSTLSLIISCTNQSPSVVDFSGSCQSQCEDEEMLKARIEEYFGLAPETYIVMCSECQFDRGGGFKARLEKDGTPLEVAYHWGWCSSGGADCGHDLCFSSPRALGDTWDVVKKKACEQTGRFLQRCSAGEFEQGWLKKTLSYTIQESRSDQSIQPWKPDCWEAWSSNKAS